MRRGNYKEEDEVEQLLQAAQDEMILKLSVNSHTSRSSSDYLDPDLHSRFLALRSQPSTKKKDQQHRQKRRPRSPPPKSKDVVEETPEDLMLRFAALKTSLPSSSSVLLPNEIGEEDSDEIGEDAEVEKLIQWAIDSRVYTDFSESSPPNSTFLNLNFTSLKPILIVKPKSESEIKSSILCSRKLGVQVRTMSGGHDYEGLSYLSQSPFIIIDLVNLRSININLTDETAWIQSGATLGELYYKIAKTSKIHAFAAGICPSVGVGGHISGGGFGTIMRKHGLASDNVVDARLMDVNGRILDRKTMGEDLFWALRGGGAASFGVVLSWKVKLARVPEKVTCFISQHPMGSSMNKLVHRWQSIGSELDEDLFIRVIIDNSLEGNQRKVKTTFQTLFLGGIDRLIPLMNQKFPELGLRAQDCSEMSWIESIMFFNWRSGQPLEILLNRDLRFEDQYFKAKTDYVQNPVPENVFGEVTKRFLEQDTPLMILEPLGGKISQVSETESPYPHRKGNLYNIQYMVKWKVNEVEEMNKHVRWMRSLYNYMSPYVSKSPRGAYLNYRDLDLGTNKGINTCFEDARKWGERYYKGNFKRLCLVKGKIDPTNFFRNEQSIPPLF